MTIAPLRHTIILVAFFVLLALGGAWFQTARPAVQRHADATPLYLSLIALQWAMVVYVRKGLRIPMRELIGPGRIVVDGAVAAAMYATWGAFLFGWRFLSGPDHAVSVRSFFPSRAHEIVLWIALSVTAGICEELVFRGYLQRQFAALSGSTSLGVILQALLFGISHGYQGVAACAKITAYGLLFGAVAVWRGSLRSGMMAHAATDIFAGLL